MSPAARGKTFTAAQSERAVQWEEDIKEQKATVEEYVTKVHGDLHHLKDGTSEVLALQPITLKCTAVIQSESALFDTNTLSHSSA